MARGMDALPDLFRALLGAATQVEHREYLGAASNERTEVCTGQASGYKDKALTALFAAPTSGPGFAPFQDVLRRYFSDSAAFLINHAEIPAIADV